jgi:hypothetical protein
MPVIPDLKKNVKEMKIFLILREFYILAISDWLRETMVLGKQWFLGNNGYTDVSK